MMNSKVAIVTGGGRGIGAEIVLHLLSLDMRVIVAEVKTLDKSFDLRDPSS